LAKKDNYPAAKAALNYQVEGFNPADYSFSNWFLPTAGQITKILEAYKVNLVNGSTDSRIYDISEQSVFSALKKSLFVAGIELSFEAWTSTEESEKNAVTVRIGGAVKDQDSYFSKYDKDEMMDVRPFIAF
jgi:hypothetical protein